MAFASLAAGGASAPRHLPPSLHLCEDHLSLCHSPSPCHRLPQVKTSAVADSRGFIFILLSARPGNATQKQIHFVLFPPWSCSNIADLINATNFARYGERFLLTWVVADLMAFLLLLLTSLTFAICCWSRQWLLYPNYNYLSWYRTLQLKIARLQLDFVKGLGGWPPLLMGSCCGGLYCSRSGHWITNRMTHSFFLLNRGRINHPPIQRVRAANDM